MAIIPYEARGLGFDVLDGAAVWACYTKLEEARELALKAPLHIGLQLSLDVAVPQRNPDPRSRPIPVGLRPGESTVSFELVEGLQTDAGNFSQMWTARIINVPRTLLVLKIIQPSMSSYPPGDESWLGEYTHPEDLAGSEAWAYEAMKSKQGCIIPYFFGLRTIITPSGEAAWVLILEYIPGRTLEQLASPDSIPDIHKFCKLGLAAIHELTLVGVVPPDVRPPNFLFTGEAVVIIDFAWMQPIRDPAQVGRIANSQQINLFSVIMRAVRDVYPDIYEWGTENLAEHIWRR
ncbi:hypothetical protein C8R46DRAFT_1227096 [Mycena filopes]|nr:hypothetical protein C8R46DRAFT_1227096 [Mycena filopes]